MAVELRNEAEADTKAWWSSHIRTPRIVIASGAKRKENFCLCLQILRRDAPSPSALPRSFQPVMSRPPKRGCGAGGKHTAAASSSSSSASSSSSSLSAPPPGCVVVGCDIGGVLRDLTTEQPMPVALESVAALRSLPATVLRIVLISKCNANWAAKSNEWMASHPELSGLPVCYCLSYEDKLAIALSHHCTAMIDDKIAVLQSFPEHITKIWFVPPNEEQKLKGTAKHQPEILKTLQVARSWEDVVAILRTLMEKAAADMHAGSAAAAPSK